MNFLKTLSLKNINFKQFLKFNKNYRFFFSNLALTFAAFSYYYKNKQISECFSTTRGEISNTFYPANDPIEDRYEIKYIQSMDNALFLSVLDGHGGYELSEFANQRLSRYIEEFFHKEKGEDQVKIKNSIKKSFAKIEQEFYDLALKKYNNGEGKASCVGSCALICLIYKDVLYVANLGDSKARLIKEDNGTFRSVKLMHRHNSEKPREKEKLFKLFPEEKDIVICKRADGTVCYVKGRLQPTRSFGDLHLKYKEFNEHQGSNFKRPISNFNGPYISSIPELTIYPLNYDEDKYLIVATDGLCDHVTSNEVCDILNKKKDAKAEDFLHKVLLNAATESNKTIDQLKNISLGKRRNYHDDTTIIFLPLKK